VVEPLDAAGTEVVLRRAFELAQVSPAPAPLRLEPQTLAEIAREVDLPLPALAAALAEHQLGVEEPSASLIDRLVGPRRVVARRASTAPEDEAIELARAWFDSGHGLRPRVTAAGVVVGTKRSDVVGKVARTVRDAQGQGRLGKVRRVEFVAVDIGEQPGAMAVSADLGDQRRAALLGGLAVSAGASTAIGIGALILSPFVLVGLPVAAGAGFTTSRLVHHRNVTTAGADLEELLDDVARREPPPSLLQGVTDRLARSFRRRRPR
jgi:hypothetical protein